MKKSLHILIIAISLVFTLTASIKPVEKVVILKEEMAVVTIDSEFKEIFSAIKYDKNTESFEFRTDSEICFVQIFNDSSELIIQMPVTADHVKIEQNIFRKGEYKIGFVFDAFEDIIFTNLMMN